MNKYLPIITQLLSAVSQGACPSLALSRGDDQLSILCIVRSFPLCNFI